MKTVELDAKYDLLGHPFYHEWVAGELSTKICASTGGSISGMSRRFTEYLETFAELGRMPALGHRGQP